MLSLEHKFPDPPFLSPVAHQVALERLRVSTVYRPRVPSRASALALQFQASAPQVIADLRSAGIIAEVSKNPPWEIVGGVAMVQDSPIRGYEEGFVISLEEDGSYLVVVAGTRRNRIERHKTKTLIEAAQVLGDVYKQRRSGLAHQA
jgi:hypothetical protein